MKMRLPKVRKSRNFIKTQLCFEREQCMEKLLFLPTADFWQCRPEKKSFLLFSLFSAWHGQDIMLYYKITKHCSRTDHAWEQKISGGYGKISKWHVAQACWKVQISGTSDPAVDHLAAFGRGALCRRIRRTDRHGLLHHFPAPDDPAAERNRDGRKARQGSVLFPELWLRP